MLSHRSETKNEEPSVYPVNNNLNQNSQRESRIEGSNKSEPTAVLGPKIRFKGELVGEEDLLIQGHVEGTIDLKGHNLIVGESGVLKANASAKTVIVEGRVDGDLYGQERIAIRSSSQVQGNIKADRVVLEDGAKFRGAIEMDMGDNAPQVREPREKQIKKPEGEN